MDTTCLTNDSASRENPCIWMQAGVVSRKSCNRDYDCMDCCFDRALQRAADDNRKLKKTRAVPEGKRGRIVFWKDNLKKLPPWKQPCLHYMKGSIGFRACNNEYNCGNCEFDQFFSDQYAVHMMVRPVDVLSIQGVRMPQGYYLHRGHAWVRIEEDAEVRVGMDDFALRLFGPLDRITAPLMGKKVTRNRPDVQLERGEMKAGMLSPVSGVVTAINPDLRKNGGLADNDPYTDGWIMRVATDNIRGDLKELMIGDETKDCIVREMDRLYDMIETVAGPLAADGGHMGHDIHGNMPQLGWDRLVREFLRG